MKESWRENIEVLVDAGLIWQRYENPDLWNHSAPAHIMRDGELLQRLCALEKTSQLPDWFVEKLRHVIADNELLSVIVEKELLE